MRAKLAEEVSMKKAIVAVLTAVLLTSGLLAGCEGDLVVGSRNLETREMDFSGFTRVDAGYVPLRLKSTSLIRTA